MFQEIVSPGNTKRWNLHEIFEVNNSNVYIALAARLCLLRSTARADNCYTLHKHTPGLCEGRLHIRTECAGFNMTARIQKYYRNAFIPNFPAG